ncbi:dipeptidase [Bacillus sp. AFS002410]|uniref:C69 family dipeptidase n=1 Tax=Bacillus sp. AFS002410 TaxID=2033481 RepID=UPI000BF1C908|nr:C69 family dipeptidase [Bacillus sp. AFS002410]PEJ60844.1 dipeptidase [Bacillus sp. AFS002410]
MKRKIGSCTTILVGKNASIDGSTLIARNEDGSGESLNPQKFVVINPEDQPKVFHSVVSGVEIPLPDNPLRYTSTPDANDAYGIWAGGGINSNNVAMTATETITTNARILGIDPLVKSGIGEADILTIVLPYIHSAKEGVIRLGELLERYGTYESNGIAFADKDEIWYLETIGGHHWAAVRIPDDAYVIAPNRLNIDHFDFDSKDTLYSTDLPELIEKYHLNPDFNQVNLRHIFGSATIKDTRYNNPRAWYIQKYFNPEIEKSPSDHDLPFICHANRKISVEDIKWTLSSHFQNTQFDPYGKGNEAEKHLFRPIGINRNQGTHILQIRNDVPAEIAGVHWLAFGPNTFNAMIPFYANVSTTPACYHNTTETFDPNTIYWLSRTIALIGDANYDLYSDLEASFEQNTVAACRAIQIRTDQEAINRKDILTYLEGANEQMAELSLNNTLKLLGNMVGLGSAQMKLRYSLND